MRKDQQKGALKPVPPMNLLAVAITESAFPEIPYSC